MIDSIILFLAIFLTILLINYKYSTAIRIIAFHESETDLGAKFAFLLMLITAFLWTIIFS